MRLYLYLILAVLVASPSIAQTDTEVVKEQVVGEPGQDAPAWGEVDLEDLPSLELTELEALKGENLQLKYDSIDKQMRLMQVQYQQLQARQTAIIAELQEVQREILKSHGLEGTIDWAEKKINSIAKEIDSIAKEVDSIAKEVSSEGDPVSEEKE